MVDTISSKEFVPNVSIRDRTSYICTPTLVVGDEVGMANVASVWRQEVKIGVFTFIYISSRRPYYSFLYIYAMTRMIIFFNSIFKYSLEHYEFINHNSSLLFAIFVLSNFCYFYSTWSCSFNKELPFIVKFCFFFETCYFLYIFWKHFSSLIALLFNYGFFFGNINFNYISYT